MDTPDEFAPTEWELALRDPDHHLLGWDPSGAWCGLFVLAHDTARLVDHREVGLDELRAYPLRTAVCYRHGSYLWAIDDRGCTIWDRLFSIALDERGDVLQLPGWKLPKAQIVAVHSFSDDEDRKRHGVELALADGSVRYVLMSHVEGDDGAWARDVAQRLAERFDLPYRHLVPGGYKPAWLADQAKSRQQTTALIEGIVDAMVHYDDPDRVAEREKRDAARAHRDAQILGRAYITTGQQRIAAWDRDDPTRLRIAVAEEVSDSWVMRLEERRTVEAHARQSVVAELRARGDAIGATYRDTFVYWVIDDTMCALFRSGEPLCVLSRVDDELDVRGRTISIRDVSAVVAFVSPMQYGHRGLALALANGEHVLVSEDDSARYDAPVLADNARGWTAAIAPELAAALGVTSRLVVGDVIERPPPHMPAERVLEACGAPVLARTLPTEERERARREGRVVSTYSFGWSGMGDSESHAGFVVRDREQGVVADDDLVFEKPVPTDIDGSSDDWRYQRDVYRAFGIEPPA